MDQPWRNQAADPRALGAAGASGGGISAGPEAATSWGGVADPLSAAISACSACSAAPVSSLARAPSAETETSAAVLLAQPFRTHANTNSVCACFASEGLGMRPFTRVGNQEVVLDADRLRPVERPLQNHVDTSKYINEPGIETACQRVTSALNSMQPAASNPSKNSVTLRIVQGDSNSKRASAYFNTPMELHTMT